MQDQRAAASSTLSSSHHWDDVRVFLAAHRYKSLGAAAVKLEIDTSTMSRRLSAFEERLGVRLFERTRAGLIATHAADAVVLAAEAMEAAWGRLGRDLSVVEGAVGTVRITAAPGMADAFIAPLLVKLRKLHPGIEIELDAATQPRDIARHEAEIAIRTSRPQGAELVITTIGSGPWVVAGAAALLKKHRPLLSFNALPWITWDKDLAQFEPARWVARHVDKTNVALRTSHFASQLVAASSGLGLVLTPSPYLRKHRLSAVELDQRLAAVVSSLSPSTLWLVGHRAHREVPRIAAVWDFLADELRTAMHEDQ